MKNKPTAATVARTIVLMLALINQICTTLGRPVIEFEDDLITQLVSGLITIGAAVIAWWKNNSFTGAAIEADEVMNAIKRGEVDTDTVTIMLSRDRH